ncbi:MAG TPA: glycosyltransferase [Polyangiaceae bacterium]|jgi:glycosyltransferase involved in cell wall biosynthesis
MRNPYRIAVVTTSYPSTEHDWVGHFVRQEALELVASGCDVTVMTTRLAFCDAGVRAIDLGDEWLSPFGPPGAAARIRAFPPRALGVATWAARVSSALRRERWDRVVAHWAIPSALAAIGVPAPLDVVSHGSDVRLLLALPAIARRALVRSIASRARTWRFVSDALRELLVASLDRATAERVRAIASVQPPPIAIPDVSGRAARLRAELGAFHVSLGRLVASKRVDRAIDRAAARGETLVVVGDGPERASLERRAARARADVRFLGDLPRDEALAYLAAARSLLFASEAEGCSTVVREARALGAHVDVL